jgi:Lrp/AsnC family leucine-responsive transcriptional regulator
MTDETVVLDPIDREILSILANDGRIPWQTLGDRVHLSANAAAERARRLMRSGVITGYGARMNPAALGRTLEAVIEVRAADNHRFEQGALEREEVTWMAHVTGRFDFQLHVACAGTMGLDALLAWFKQELTMVESLTTVILRRLR